MYSVWKHITAKLCIILTVHVSLSPSLLAMEVDQPRESAYAHFQPFPLDDFQNAEDILASELDAVERRKAVEQKTQFSSDVFNPLAILYQLLVGKNYDPYRIQLSDPSQLTGLWLTLLLLNGQGMTEQAGYISLQMAVMSPRMNVREDGNLYVIDQYFFTQEAYLNQVIDPIVKKRLNALSGESFLLAWLGKLPSDFGITIKQYDQLCNDLMHLQEYCQTSQRNVITHRDLFKSLDILCYTFYWPEDSQLNVDRSLSCEELNKLYQLTRRNMIYKGGQKKFFDVLALRSEEEANLDTALFSSQDIALKLIHSFHFHTNQLETGRAMFKMAAYSPFNLDKEHLPAIWQQKAKEYLTFEQNDDGRLIDFCCRLGIDSNSNRNDLPLLHAAVENVHEGTRGNLFALLRHGANRYVLNTQRQTVLDVIIAKRLMSQSNESTHLDDILRFLVGSGIVQHFNADQAYKLYQVTLGQNNFFPIFETLSRESPELAWHIVKGDLFQSNPDRPGGKVIDTLGGRKWFQNSYYQQIYNSNSNFKRYFPDGKRDVGLISTSTGIKVCIKRWPESPGLEYAMYSFTHKLFGCGIPPSEIFRIQVNDQNEVLQASLYIDGTSLQEVIDKTPTVLQPSGEKSLLDEKSLSATIVTAALTNPEDGRPPNYILAHHLSRLFSIDNDHVFGPTIEKTVSEGIFRNFVLKTRSVLWCLDDMKSTLHPDIRVGLIEKLKEPLTFLKEWLKALRVREQEFRQLFPELENSQETTIRTNYKKFLKDQGTYIGIPLTESVLDRLHTKLLVLQSLAQRSGDVTHLDVLSELEPHLASHIYRPLLCAPLSVKERFERSDGRTFSTTRLSHHLEAMDATHMEPFRLEEAFTNLDEALKTISDMQRNQVRIQERTREGFAKMTPSFQRAFVSQLDLEGMPLREKETWFRHIGKYTDEWTTLLLHPKLYINDSLLGLFSMRNVSEMEISGCEQLTDQAFVTISEQCRGLKVLKAANLSNVKNLRRFERSFFGGNKESHLSFPSLKFLDISQQTELNRAVLQIPHLKVLIANGCSNLEYTDLACDVLEDFDLRECTSFTHESLQRIIQNSSLRSLQLENCSQFDAYKNLFVNIQDISIAWYISVIKNQRNREFVLKEYRKVQHDNKRSIQLFNQDSYIDDESMSALAKIAEKNLTLESLEVRGSTFRDDGCLALEQMLNINKVLNDLCLAAGFIGDGGAEALGRALTVNIVLTSLNLGNNCIGIKGSVILAKALEVNKTLKNLNIGANRAGIEGGRAFGKMLAINNTLTGLTINKVGLENDGCIAFAEGLKTNKGIKYLDLECNQFTDNGGASLEAALAQNETLTDLRLFPFRVSITTSSFESARSIEASWREEDRVNNKISKDILEKINKHIKRNNSLARASMAISLAKSPTSNQTSHTVQETKKKSIVEHRSYIPRIYFSEDKNQQFSTSKMWTTIQRQLFSGEGINLPFCALISLQGTSDLPFQYLMHLEEEIHKIDSSLPFQAMFDGMAGTGPAGVLALCLNVPILGRSSQYNYKVQQLSRWFAPWQITDSSLLEYILKANGTNPLNLGHSVGPLLLTIGDDTYEAAEQYSEDGLKLTKRMMQESAKDPSLLLTRFARDKDKWNINKEQPLFLLSLGVVEDSATTDHQLNEQRDVYYVRPYLSDGVDNNQIQAIAKLLIVNYQQRHGLAKQESDLSDILDVLIQGEMERLASLDETALYRELKRQESAQAQLEAEATVHAIVESYAKRKSLFVQQTLNKGKKIWEDMKGVIYRTGVVTNSAKVIEQKAMGYYKAVIEQLKHSTDEEAIKLLENFYTWKKGLWYQMVHQQMELVLVTHEALSLETVRRNIENFEMFANAAGSAATYGVSFVPIAGPIASSVFDKMKTVSLELYYGKQSREHTQRITALYNNEGLRGMLRVCKQASTQLLYRLHDRVKDLTPTSLIDFAFCLVDHLMTIVKNRVQKSDIMTVIDEVTTYQVNLTERLQHFVGAQELLKDDNTAIRPEEIWNDSRGGDQEVAQAYTQKVLEGCGMHEWL